MEANKQRTTNRSQFSTMVENMKKHPDIATNMTKKPPDAVLQFWDSLAAELNNLGSPCRSVAEWKKVWSHYKSGIKKKLTHNKRGQNGTGGGQNTQMFLSSLEEEVVELTSMHTIVNGIPKVASFGAPARARNEVLLTARTHYNFPSTSRAAELMYADVEVEQANEEVEGPGDDTPNQQKRNREPKQIRLLEKQIQINEEHLDRTAALRYLEVSISYHKKYNRDIDHDNIYISEYFKCIDQDRKSRGKSTILPLRKFEKYQLIDVANIWQRTREESRTVAYHLLQFALETVTALFFLFLDYLIVTILLVIRTNSHVAFVQEGEHTIHFSIQGSGLIARLLRTTMKNFNMHETVSTYMTNEQCLPRPSILPRDYYLKLLGLYALVIFLIYQSATILRMRRLICAYFYRKREKRRIIYLYNLLLREKRSVMEKMLKQAKLNFANRKIRLRANIFLKLRLKCPRHFGWLRRFNVARRKCVICDEFEDENFTFCSSPLCGVSYCNHCWMDMGNQCLVCNEVISVEMILNFNDFFEEFPFV